jgi:hypothetical protein
VAPHDLAASSLRRLSDREHLLEDIVAGHHVGIGDLLSAACQLQLDLQVASPTATVAQARSLARELCSALSHLGPDRHDEAIAARRIIRRLESLLITPHSPSAA